MRGQRPAHSRRNPAPTFSAGRHCTAVATDCTGGAQALDKELGQHLAQAPDSCWPTLAFDESGNFVLFPSLLGIKVTLLAPALAMPVSCRVWP